MILKLIRFIFNFKMFPAGPKKKLCAVCRIPLEPLDDKIMIERHHGIFL
jgi:hypothetical protein